MSSKPSRSRATTASQPGMVDDVHPLTDAELKECNGILDAVYAAKEGARLIATDFHALPNRSRYPDYYETIPEPVCLDEVETKLEKREFASAQAFVIDLQLVFQNAMHYNEDDSSIWKDAKRLDDLVSEMYDSAEEEGILPPRVPVKVTASSHQAATAATTAANALKAAAPISPSVAPSGTATNPLPAMPPKKRGRPTKEEAAARAAAGYVKKPPRVKNRPVNDDGPALSTAGTSTPAPLPQVSIPWETYIPPSPSKMSEPELSDQEDAKASYTSVANALDETLPRAEGWEVDEGWMAKGKEGEMAEILSRVKGHADAIGRRLAESLEDVATPTDNQLLSFQEPMSLDLVESRVAAGEYKSCAEFDQDMSRLFEKARRWHPVASPSYADILILQRYYQDLTSDKPNSTTAATHFSSVAGGPGNARSPAAPGSAETVATFRISTRDRTYVDVASYKGYSYAAGDYVHVANADEPGKPIVGQVFKVFKPTKGAYEGQLSVSVCWYFRPEETIHPASRLFWENEIMKTGYFGDHVLADIIEKVGAQFYSKAIRGRPKAPFWYPGWPLYVVECRYNAKERQMIKIKNWASCIPEELRKSDFMPLTTFRQVVTLLKVISPFLRGATGPGCLGYPENKKGAGGEGESTDGEEGASVDGQTPGRPHKKPKRNDIKTLQSSSLQYPTAGPSVSAFASGSATPSVLAGYSTQRPSPALSRRPSAAPGAMTAPPLPYARPNQPLASGSRPPVSTGGGQQRKIMDLSVVGNSGGSAWVSKTSLQSSAPADVVQRFPTDPATGNLLWFSGPPVSLPPHTRPSHSQAYLNHVAQQKLANPGATDGSSSHPTEFAPLDLGLIDTMRGVLQPDLLELTAKKFTKEFEGLEESPEWQAFMRGL